MSTITPQAGRRYRRAAAFLIHWQGPDKDLGTEGVVEVLTEAEAEGPGAVAGMMAAVGELAWKMTECGDPVTAMEYLRRVASKAAVDEVAS